MTISTSDELKRLADAFRATFEQWYVENCFDLQANPIGSRDCGLQWKAWDACAQALAPETIELRKENDQLRQQLACTIDILEQTRKDLAYSNKRQDELQAERDQVVFAEVLQDEIAKGHAQ